MNPVGVEKWGYEADRRVVSYLVSICGV